MSFFLYRLERARRFIDLLMREEPLGIGKVRVVGMRDESFALKETEHMETTCESCGTPTDRPYCVACDGHKCSDCCEARRRVAESVREVPPWEWQPRKERGPVVTRDPRELNLSTPFYCHRPTGTATARHALGVGS